MGMAVSVIVWRSRESKGVSNLCRPRVTAFQVPPSPAHRILPLQLVDRLLNRSGLGWMSPGQIVKDWSSPIRVAGTPQAGTALTALRRDRSGWPAWAQSSARTSSRENR